MGVASTPGGVQGRRVCCGSWCVQQRLGQLTPWEGGACAADGGYLLGTVVNEPASCGLIHLGELGTCRNPLFLHVAVLEGAVARLSEVLCHPTSPHGNPPTLASTPCSILTSIGHHSLRWCHPARKGAERTTASQAAGRCLCQAASHQPGAAVHALQLLSLYT
jgi:hypothetical protein